MRAAGQWQERRTISLDPGIARLMERTNQLIAEAQTNQHNPTGNRVSLQLPPAP